MSGLRPNAVVVVATVRALKLNGGADKTALNIEDTEALGKGMCNLLRHVSNIKDVYRLPVIVAINRFTSDTEREIAMIENAVNQLGVQAVDCDVWGKGGQGATALAKKVVKLCNSDNGLFRFAYQDGDDVCDKIRSVASKIYGADGVEFSDKALASLEALSNAADISKMPVVIAKTQYSFSDDPTLLGAPTGFNLHVRDVEYRGGAGFLVVLAGNMLLMPGLPKRPNAVGMTVSDDGVIDGLY